MTAFVVTLGLLLAGTVAWLAAHQAPQDPVQATTPVASAMLEQGRAYYVQLCMACHGARGDGQGEWAYRVTPRPASLRSARTRARSDDYLDRLIREGLPGTPMTGYSLSDAQRRQLVAYLRYLGGQP
jgi:mono/diheme cytochrome c family protein